MMTANTIRRAIAQAWLADRPNHTHPTPTRLGTITLHPHQRSAADRLQQMLAANHGALLADPTGVGKTYIALAVATAMRTQTLIITPATLRPMWRDAIARTNATATILSMETLSQTPPRIPTTKPDLIVVDEAHHFRNPSTHRYAALRALATRTPILLLSATPIHNSTHDLRTLLALFLGSHAHTTDEPSLTRHIVRRDNHKPTSHSRKPTVNTPVWITIPHDESTLNAILNLPAPVPPSDGEAAAALVTHSLLRQWASSQGALREALTRRLHRAAALESALTHHHHPTYRDLRSWCLGEGAIQLAFPELLIPASTESDPQSLLDAVRKHADAVRAVLHHLATIPNPDHHRATRIREILLAHPGQPIVAFSAYEDTIHTLARLLSHTTRVCALSAHAARVANGTITRHQAITRFAPIANHARLPSQSHRIDLLLTTDLLSEGVNLQDAPALIHLDLPWTPARIEQRLGRLARLGSPHSHVTAYAFAPPAPSESLLGIDRRLHHKLHETGRTFGLAGSILPPPLGTFPERPSPPPIRATLERWLSENENSPQRNSERIPERSEARAGAPTAAIEPPRQGWIALCRVGPTPYLVASLDDGPPTDDPQTVAEALLLAEGQEPQTLPPDADAAALSALANWTQHRQAHHDAGAITPTTSTRIRLLRRIAATLRHAPPTRLPTMAPAAARARRAATGSLTAGAEQLLATLVTSVPPDGDDLTWLNAVAAFADQHTQTQHTPLDTEAEILALLILHTPPVNFHAGCPPPPSLPSSSTSTAPCSIPSSCSSAPSATPSATAPAASPPRKSGSQA
jgi:superfamily II DNA or RNA helicase